MGECHDCRCDDCANHAHCIAIPEKLKQQLNGQIPIKSKLAEFLRQENALNVPKHNTVAYNVTFKELLHSVIINPNIDVKEFLMSHNTALRGNLYQSLWMIMIILDRVNPFTSTNFDIIDGKIENEKDMVNPKFMDRGAFFETSFNTGNKSGISDLTFKLKINDDQTKLWACEMTVPFQEERYILASFKFYNKEAGVNSYDVQDIVQAMERYIDINPNRRGNVKYNIILFIHNKTEFAKKLDSTTKKHFKEDVGGFTISVNANGRKMKIHVESIYDLSDLCKIIQQFRDANNDRHVTDIIKSPNGILSLSARFHQLLFVNKTVDSIINDNEKLFVWGQIARSGKTYTAGLLVSHLYKTGYVQSVMEKKIRPFVTLVITPAPAETLEQFYDDMFKLFTKDFGAFEVHLLNRNTMKTVQQVMKTSKKPIIFISSKQFLHAGVGKTEKGNDDYENLDEKGKTKYIKAVRKVIESNIPFLKCVDNEPKVDLVIFDEVHLGGGTEISQTILNVLDSEFKRDVLPVQDGNVIKIFLTATYKRPVDLFKVKSHQLMTWGINDIELCKFITNTQAYELLCERFNTSTKNYVRETIKQLRQETTYSKEQFLKVLQAQYLSFPTLMVMTSLQDEKWLKDTLNINVNEYSTNRKYLFELVKDKENIFQNEIPLKDLLRYIGDTNLTNGIFRRINRLFKQHEQDRPFRSYMWFIPFFEGSRIANVSSALKELMETDSKLKHIYAPYSIIIAGDGVTKTTIKVEEKKANMIGKKGVIILAGMKFSVGVSFPCVDVVILLNNDKEVDITYQRMFRALTESHKKKIGVLVDLYPYRTIQTLTQYVLPPDVTKKLSKGQDENGAVLKAFEYLNKHQLILFDSDKITLERDKETIYRNLYTKIEEYLRKQFENSDVTDIKKSLEVKLAAVFQKLPRKFLEHFIKTSNQPTKMILLEAEKEQVQIDSNKKKEKKTRPKDSKSISDKSIENIRSSLMKILSDLVVAIPILLKDESTKYVNKSFEYILKKVYETYADIEECDDIDDEVGHKGNRFIASVYNIIVSKIELLIKKDNTNNKCELISAYLQKITSLIDELNLSTQLNSEYNKMKKVIEVKSAKIEDLYAFVEEHLKPKELESKLRGEVFTPLSLVEEMLTAVEKYGDKGIWSNPNIKILDPAVGIGNFPIVVYKKMMKGLEKVDGFKDEELRRKHILENVLYMVELSTTNVKLLKKIFGDKHYNLNVLNTDFLIKSITDINTNADLSAKQKADGKKLVEWKKTIKFDLVMGNPPYQKQVGPDKTSTLWDKFILEVLPICEQNGHIAFVHPSGWRNIDGIFKTVQRELIKRSILYLEMHNEKDGLKTFNKETRYDWYVMKNKLDSSSDTIIITQSGQKRRLNLKGKEFIPSGEIDKIYSILADKNEEKVEVLYSRSEYGTDKKWMSKTRDNKHIHPCIYTVNYKDEGTFFYSAEHKGHFGIPKLIWSNGRISSVGSLVDERGDFGLTQFAYAIADKRNRLHKIKMVFDSDEFRHLMEMCAVGQLTINYKIIALFKKDFWKQFIKAQKGN